MNLAQVLLIGVLVITRFNICYSQNVEATQETENLIVISWKLLESASSYVVSGRENERDFHIADLPTPEINTTDYKGFDAFTNYTILVKGWVDKILRNVGQVTIETWPGVPSAPTIDPRYTRCEENTILVSWKPPTDIPGILGEYNATAKIGDEVQGFCVMSSSPCNISDGLSYSTKYKVSVIATIKPNENGQGGGVTESDVHYVITKRKRLPAPEDLQLSQKKVGEITGSWKNLPAEFPNVVYEFNCVPNEPTSYFRVNKLKIRETKQTSNHPAPLPYTDYNCSVIACYSDSHECSVASTKIITTLATKPGPPTEVVLKNMEVGKVHVSWVNPTVKNGPLDNVFVYEGNGETDEVKCNLTKGEPSNCIIEGLRNFTEYKFAVAGYNNEDNLTGAGGFGEKTYSQVILTPPGEPGIPTDVKVIAEEEGSLTVSWVNPTDANGPLDNTTATASSDSGPPRVCYAVNQETSCKIENLTDYTDYIVTVLTCNAPLDGLGGGNSTKSQAVPGKTLAGKPKQDELKQIGETLNTSEIPVLDRKTQIPIYLKLSVINTTRMGPLSKVTVVVALGDTSKKSDAAGSNKLLSRSGDSFVDGTYKDPTEGVYEVVVPIASLNSPQDLEFIVGSPSAAETNGHNYNGPLTPGSTYSISARIYTESGYETTQPTIQTTNAGVNVGLIVGLVVGAIVLIALIALIIVLVKRRNTTPDDDSSDNSDDDVVQI